MKKQFLILASTITTLVLISCGKEKIESPQPNSFEETATARKPGGGGTFTPVSNRGLLGRFEFNKNLKDMTGKLPDGTSTASRVLYTEDRKGIANNAIRFNGAYGVDLLNVPSTPDGASISVWVKHDTVPSSGWLCAVFSFKGFILQQNYNVFAGSYYTGIFGVLPIVYSSAIDKTWHHMAATRDNNELKFYIDGVLIGTAPTPAGAGPYPPAHNYALGYTMGNYWKGSLDDLRFYERVLSADELNTLANQ